LVADFGNNIIENITPGGTVSTALSGLSSPFDADIDSKGNMYIIDYGTNTIKKSFITGYTISPALPTGLIFNTSTGAITGTPTSPAATTIYTITAYNTSGSCLTTISITVNPTVPGGTPGSVCSSGPVTLSVSGSLPAGGVYTWYAALSGGASLGTGATYTTPSLTATTTYYVDYTQGGTTSSPRTAVTATVSSPPVLATVPTTPTAGLYLSYPFSGNANDVSGNSNTGIVQNAPLLTADRYGAPNSAYSFNGTSQYISTTTAIASPGPQNFSISLWFKTSSAGGRLIGFGSSQNGSSGSYDRHIYMSNSGQIYFGLFPGVIKTINTTTSYADGNWHNVVVTVSIVNGSNLYVDGALQATDPSMTTSQIYGANGYWRVGYDNLAGWTNSPTNYYFTGSLDDMVVFNTELTQAQADVLYGGRQWVFLRGKPPFTNS